MKNFKLLFLTILMITISLSTYAQESVPQELPEEGWQQVVDKYGNKAIDAFNSVVDTVVPMAEQGFMVVVRLQIAKGIVGLLPLILAIFNFFWFKSTYKKAIFDQYECNRYTILSIILGICLIPTFVIGITSLAEAIPYLLVPEWFAIKDIISLVN